jgi:hypothetical protein
MVAKALEFNGCAERIAAAGTGRPGLADFSGREGNFRVPAALRRRSSDREKVHSASRLHLVGSGLLLSAVKKKCDSPEPQDCAFRFHAGGTILRRRIE